MLDNFIIEAGVVFIVTILINLLILARYAFSTFEFSKRNDIKAVQASHVKPVPRIGGLSVIIGLVIVAIPFLEFSKIWSYYPLILLSALPVFIIGLCEDLGYFSSPRIRLLAAVISGAVFVGLFGQWLPRTDIFILDLIIQWTPFGIGFSIFLASGISHGFNLIDGLNGLAGLTAVGVALSLAAISHKVGLTEHRDVLLILSSALAGFLVFNFPFGKIFLGDGGAYLIGHILIWTAISILYLAPSVTPFAMLLIFFLPIADTLLAIARRLYLGSPISHPDRLHFHQLIMRGIEIIVLGRKKRHIANPLATILIMPFAFIPMITGILLANDRFKAISACFFITVFFLITYKFCIWMTRRFRYSG
jgi:UDP-GlcNAc:undecaprenyl-phosphate/decaprenyl-phosphate GlcNAc-1-phosphate transferase